MRDGEKNGRARLTSRRVAILRGYYFINKRPRGAPKHHSWVTPDEIAHRLGMAISSVRSMLEGQTWKQEGVMEGCKAFPGWEKGAKVRLFTKQIVEVLDNGHYVWDETSGLWYFRIRYADGREATWVPCVGDWPLKNGNGETHG